jgi:hypothetical protein
MKFKPSHLLAAATILVLGIVWVRVFCFGEIFHTHKQNAPNRAGLLRIRDAIPIGASHSDVLSVYWQHRTEALRLSVGNATNWGIEMPLELGANDWGLCIHFQHGKATTVRVRTSDGAPPKDGPKDKEQILRGSL